MRARVVRIGNSRGVRIPKPLIEQAGLQDEVEIAVEGSSLIIRVRCAAPRGLGDGVPDDGRAGG